MSERDQPREPLEVQIERKFKGVSDEELIRRIESASDFAYDDEQYELNRRLAVNGKTWRWNGDRVEVIGFEMTRDELLIDRAVVAWEEAGMTEAIDDSTARQIANLWHGGMSSALYSFASTGRIDLEGVARELTPALLRTDPIDGIAAGALGALTHYFIEHGEREVVEGWHDKTRWDRS